MSLDVWLTVDRPVTHGGSGIYIREGGRTREVSREEWDERFPDREPVAVVPSEGDGTVFEYNITHNLNSMADAAGIYKHLWHPEEVGVSRAADLIEPLRDGLARLNSDPQKYKKHNPSNGWGDYDGLVAGRTGQPGGRAGHPEVGQVV